ncbi:hypothetical protein ACSBR1_036882 [Camellia fascicularis]
MDTTRLCVVFEDRHILSKAQKSQGLNQSWILLKPQHHNISDLSTYLTHIFDLHHSCPNGIILSMDGFVLPPFESTCILKDKDVISVKRKGGMSSEIVDKSDRENLIEQEEIVEKQPVLNGMPLLANEEFEKETGNFESEPEEDEDNVSGDTLHVDNSFGGNVLSKKRKASKKLQSSKKKKRTMVPQDIENDFQTDQNESCPNDVLHRGKSIEKEKVSIVKSKPKRVSTPRSAERNNDIAEPSPNSKRFGKLQENGAGCVDAPHTPDGTKKVPSRSARRKKTKRQWLREIKRIEKELVASNLQLCERQSPEKHMPKDSIEHEEQSQNGEADDEIVPIVIRPGHIRFEPLGKDRAVQQSQVSVETFQWNGTTSKKKGQKWGKENFQSNRRNGYKDSNKECSETMAVEEVKPSNDPINFDRLPPLTSFPKEGDVIAYRLLELSPTWTPDLCSFRVGKTSRCDPISHSILLTPVPEYPLIFEKQPDGDAWAQPPDNSLYREDGSLEIDFSTLVDVRIVKHGNSVPAKVETGWVNDRPVRNEVAISTVAQSNNYKRKHAPKKGNKVNAQSPNATNALPIEENGWSNKNSWHERMINNSLEK